ncbi:MAG TPA: cytidine deaminase [Enhygromyxa sp.]|nr:cytidine deaminase [Enhygromyxa sp.]
MPDEQALPPTPTVERLDARLRGPGTVARIEADELEALGRETGLDEPALLIACLAWARRWALAPLSNFEVGAAALAGSGVLYLGANIEFCGVPLAQTVHAEQSAIAHAWSCGETTLRTIATSAAPCGFCRQFMLELPEPRPVLVLAGQGSIGLAELLPSAFGPTELGRAPQLLRSGPHGLALAEASDDPLVAMALAAADRSSAPYSGAYSGVAVETADGQRFAGAVAESVAYNPTLAPMQAALIAAHHGGGRLEQIERAVLVELEHGPISQLDAARAVLGCVAPRATLQRVPARVTGPAA